MFHHFFKLLIRCSLAVSNSWYFFSLSLVDRGYFSWHLLHTGFKST